MKVLLLFDVPETFPRGHDYKQEFADKENYPTENDVHRALVENGHEVRLLGLYDDVQPLLDEVKEHRPDVIFNLVELFHNVTHWDKNIVALIEMLGVPHTGASSSALFLCNDKAMCKKILRFHRVRTPRFHTLYRGGLVWLPATVKFPASKVISPSAASNRWAAMARPFSMILLDATVSAEPPTAMLRDPKVPVPYGTISVSPSITSIFSIGTPSCDERICAKLVSWPWP